MSASLVGSEMCIRDSPTRPAHPSDRSSLSRLGLGVVCSRALAGRYSVRSARSPSHSVPSIDS
eukprot:14974015-Alexandrium_andersonii.AAC.1